MHRLINPIFYTLKPLIPRQIQIMLRRMVAKYKVKKYTHIWPIDQNAAKPPDGWQVWPEGKQFALVLSHDVDTFEGYQNVLKLAAVEEKMGFRSVFNFVPERYGPISQELLHELKKRGFSVGVHGLRHDGKLFRSKREFDRQAPRINEYLSAWKSCGFSSPSMHHNLEWLTKLDIEYSISTFDTDPFEPQPDAAGTIFPFWVANGSPIRAYVELPYTLPQDSTLFIILKQTTIDIWKMKLDWVAEKGGMVLLNTHPDYMDFNNNTMGRMQYPVQNYVSFLKYVSDKYKGTYYHAKPIEIAKIWRAKINNRT